MATSSQKFIARNRAPRVQIEYDVELYGAQKKVQLPFVMGVMSDLSGKPSGTRSRMMSMKFLLISRCERRMNSGAGLLGSLRSIHSATRSSARMASSREAMAPLWRAGAAAGSPAASPASPRALTAAVRW